MLDIAEHRRVLILENLAHIAAVFDEKLKDS